MRDNLDKFNLFVGLNKTEIDSINNKLVDKKVKKDDFIIRENDSENKLYLLIDGVVAVTKKLTLNVGGDSEEKKLITLSASHYPVFGEIGLLGNKRRTASVVAQSDCHLLELSESGFESIVKNNYKLGYIIMKNLANIIATRLETTDNNVVKLATALSLTVFKR